MFDGNTPAGYPDMSAVTVDAVGIGVEILNNKGETLLISQEVTGPAEMTIPALRRSTCALVINLTRTRSLLVRQTLMLPFHHRIQIIFV